MAWKLQADRPFYIQLVEQLQQRIIAGTYRAGERLPSVRDLAQEASVNANTMQRALTELEQLGLVYTQRTAGRFITEDQAKIDSLRVAFAQRRVLGFAQDMQRLGFTIEQAIAFLSEHTAEIDKEDSAWTTS